MSPSFRIHPLGRSAGRATRCHSLAGRLPAWLLAGLLAATPFAQGGELTFRGTTDKTPTDYKPGEPMVFSIQLLDDGQPMAGQALKWKRTGDDGKTETGQAVSSATEPLTITTSTDAPGFVRIEVWPVDDKGKPLPPAAKKSNYFDGGAGVEPEKLQQGVPEPEDFDAFWAGQKERLAQVPMKFTLTEMPSKKEGFVTYDVRVDCAGGKPVSGYLTKPKDAAPKSLKALATYRGYGITGAEPSYRPGHLVLQINAHGIENGKDKAYYQGLGLKGYAFNNKENEKPETSYFNGMFLRVLRSLEFLKAQPEWNGKDLIVSGGSQGGFQSLAAAGLDSDVNQCQVSIPWCCDLGGVTIGRLRGWRPDWEPGLGYYDGVNMAKRIKCPTTINAGLGDYVCPPSGVSVLYNNLQVPKKLVFAQGKTHPYTPPSPQTAVLQSGGKKP